jgi:hypothetical protein
MKKPMPTDQEKKSLAMTATLEKVRPERNLEKWAIWQASRSNSKETRTLKRIITNEVGEEISSEVTIGYVDKIGTVTTEDQRTYYALVKYWEERGRPDTFVFFSLKGLAKHLKKKWGTNVIESLTQSLTRLRATPFIWKNSYYDSSTNKTKEAVEMFNILSDLKIIRSQEDGHITKEAGYFRFNNFILTNLLANHTKPVLLDVVLSFNSQLAQILYTYLDLILADKTLFKRRTKELFEELGIEGKTYNNQSNRKQKLIPALKELEGTPVTTGCIISAKLEKTTDGKDYNIVIRKGKRETYIQPLLEPKQESRGKEPSALELSREQSTLQGIAKELVANFYLLFHNVEKANLSSKAVDQAIVLVSQHGTEKANYILEFAKKEAGKTNFDIKTFGGILQYESLALLEYDRRKVQQEQSAKLRAENEEQLQRDLEEEKKALQETQAAKDYIAQLSPEKRQELRSRAIRKAIEKSPYSANRGEMSDYTIERFMIVEAKEEIKKEPEILLDPPPMAP